MRFWNNRFEDRIQVLLIKFTVTEFLHKLFYAVERGKEACNIREVQSTPNDEKQHNARFKRVCGLWADCSDKAGSNRLEWVGTHRCVLNVYIRRVFGTTKSQAKQC